MCPLDQKTLLCVVLEVNDKQCIKLFNVGDLLDPQYSLTRLYFYTKPPFTLRVISLIFNSYFFYSNTTGRRKSIIRTC